MRILPLGFLFLVLVFIPSLFAMDEIKIDDYEIPLLQGDMYDLNVIWQGKINTYRIQEGPNINAQIQQQIGDGKQEIYLVHRSNLKRVKNNMSKEEARNATPLKAIPKLREVTVVIYRGTKKKKTYKNKIDTGHTPAEVIKEMIEGSGYQLMNIQKVQIKRRNQETYDDLPATNESSFYTFLEDHEPKLRMEQVLPNWKKRLVILFLGVITISLRYIWHLVFSPPKADKLPSVTKNPPKTSHPKKTT